MTHTLPPHTPGLSRTLPALATPQVTERVRRLLEGSDSWVLRPSWAHYLRTGDDRDTVSISELTRDQAVAVHAWLRQQRHHLHRVLEGGPTAPEGWLERQPLFEAVAKRAHLET